MEDILLMGLEAAKAAGAEYVEVRGVSNEERKLMTKNGSLVQSAIQLANGISVRLLAEGRWGFAASTVENVDIVQLVEKALAGARAPASAFGWPIMLAPITSRCGSWQGDIKQDPFAIDDHQLVELLLAADTGMMREGILVRQGMLSFRRTHTVLFTSEGSRISQHFLWSGGGIKVYARGAAHQRSYPAPMGGWAGRGFEYIEELDLVGNAERIAREAVELSQAPPCPSGTADLIITGSLLASYLYQTCGRSLEFTGRRNWLLPNGLGQFCYASPQVNIIADATRVGAAGSYGFDDEGQPASALPLVTKGMITNCLCGREGGAVIGRASSASMRAADALKPPEPRVNNLHLLPGKATLADMVAGVNQGLLLDGDAGLITDPARTRFRAVAEAGWMIKNGKVTGMVKNPVFSGDVVDFWHSCDAVASREHQFRLGVIADGLPVGLELVPARFRNVRVGGCP